MTEILIGTVEGPYRLDGSRIEPRRSIRGMCRAEFGWWLVDDQCCLWRLDGSGEATEIARADIDLNCVLAVDDELWVGAAEARLLRLSRSGLSTDEEFAQAPGRRAWHTPWGGPPDVRSISAGPDGTIYVNVHVGGILRRGSDGSWIPTLDIAADVHQVLAHPQRPGTVLAATARGLAVSADHGETWSFHSEGLHGPYSRAVAAVGDRVLVSVSDGPGGGRAGLYRASVDSLTFARCSDGLPEWFTTNLNTACLTAIGDTVYAADRSGVVYASADEGATWETVVSGLPTIAAVA